MKFLPLNALTLVLFLWTNTFSQVEWAATIGWGATASTADMVVQPDDKVVLISQGCFGINFGSPSFCIVRLNPGGGLDPTFGPGSPNLPGSVIGYFASTGSTGVAVQSDGKLLVVGGGTNLKIVRYNSNGSGDSSFGTGGLATILIAGGDHRYAKIAIQPDGKIILVGAVGSQMFIARLTALGVLDATFGSGGIVRPPQGSSGLAVAIQPDGKILASGECQGSYCLVRVNSDGSPDMSWDSDGAVIIPYTASSATPPGFNSIALRPDGRVVALGHANMVYQFNPDGSPDLSFDGDGNRQAFPFFLPEVRRVVVTAGGRITVIGGQMRFSGPGSIPYYYRVARFLPNGNPDLSFSDDGYLEFSIFGNNFGSAAAVDSLGRVVVGGQSAQGTVLNPFENSLFSVARLSTPTSVPVWISGRVTSSDGRPVTNGVLTIRDSALTVIGTAHTNSIGYYRFANVQSGQSYTISARSKGRVYVDRTLSVSDDVSNFDFMAVP